MLPKSYRIRKQKEFDLIYKEHKSLNSQNLQIYLRYVNSKERVIYPERTYPRFGFVLSKKIGNAVERNRVKRLLREIIRLTLPKLKDNFEALVIPFPQIVNATYYELETEIINTLKSYNLYK
ncbi:ribonuclease P protein component [Candidatus Dojkabacteria bacterium]|nr:ribonuclease P protein component [Candidatus Dojkabacteria bacterium]